MSGPGQPERATQRRVIALFREEPGYRFLGDWSDRAGNSNIETGLLSEHLLSRGYTSARIARAIDLLKREDDAQRAVLGLDGAVPAAGGGDAALAECAARLSSGMELLSAPAPGENPKTRSMRLLRRHIL